MSKHYFIRHKELEDLNLSQEIYEKILLTKSLGHSLSSEEGYLDFPLGKKIIKIINPSKIDSVEPKSSLKETPIVAGDLIVGFDGMPLFTGHGEPVLENETGSTTSLYNYLAKVKEGQNLKIHYAKKKAISGTQSMGINGRAIYQFETKEVELSVNFLYNLEEYPNLIKIIENKKIKNLPNRIKNSLYNQDHAVDEIYKNIKVYFAGLKEDDKPIGGYLLLGPTGTGKTELAKLISKELGFNLIRIDMSEYVEYHTISRLLGSPPGYIGHDKPTILETELGSEGVKAVLLLDEVEKAHQDVQKAFLQVMDNKELTLGNGNKVDFSNVLIIMTSNAGISQSSGIGVGANLDEKKISVDMNVVSKLFLPEFIGRLSGVIEFNALDDLHAHKILDKFVKEFSDRVSSKHNVSVDFSLELKKHLVKKGFDKIYGARPLKNALAKEAFEKIADLILFDPIEANGIIMLDIKDQQIVAGYRKKLQEV